MTAASSADVSRASTMIELGRFAEAIRALTAMVAASPHDGRAWCLLARAQLGNGSPGAAVRAARRASAADPADDWPYRLAGMALIDLGRPADAVAAASRARELAPQFWRSHVCLAQAALAAGDTGLAREARAAALALAPEEAEVHVVAGKVALGEGDLEEAAASQRAALAIDPANVGAVNELGLISLRRRDPAGAAGHFIEAVRRSPGSSVFRGNYEAALARVAAGIAASGWLVAVAIAAVVLLAGVGSASPWALMLAGLLAALGAADAVRRFVAVPRTARPRLAGMLWRRPAGLALGAAAVIISRLRSAGRRGPASR